MITKVNIYRDGEQWCYAAFSGREFDHCDVLDVESVSCPAPLWVVDAD